MKSGKFVDEHGVTFWYLNGILHREDGPAVADGFGQKAWYKHGQLHREEGPAIEWSDGRVSWALFDEYVSEEEFNLYRERKFLHQSLQLGLGESENNNKKIKI
ncbi:hypothetical protein [Ralstonia pseudosolanacearum]